MQRIKNAIATNVECAIIKAPIVEFAIPIIAFFTSSSVCVPIATYRRSTIRVTNGCLLSVVTGFRVIENPIAAEDIGYSTTITATGGQHCQTSEYVNGFLHLDALH
jgi:hypothetical protein